MQILLIPADRAQPCRVIDVDADRSWRSVVGDLIGSPLGQGLYDRDATLWMHDDGLNRGLPVNTRAVAYATGHSEAAARNRIRPGQVCFWGDVVATGWHDGDVAGDVPQRLITIIAAC